MGKLDKTLGEYEENGGWSSHHFAANGAALIRELMEAGADVKIGRTVIHVSNGDSRLKAYVHHNGRSREYATITDWAGEELLTVHHTEFEKLRDFVLEYTVGIGGVDQHGRPMIPEDDDA